MVQSEQDASVYRLYCAYFLRLPDPEGFAFWRTAIASDDWTLDTASSFFAEGEESGRRYGSLSNEQFIDLVYLNVMNRVGEPGGRTFWNGRLDDGMSRGRLMLEFSDAPEFKGKVATPIATLDQIDELLSQITVAPAVKASSEYDRDDYPYREAKKLAYVRDLRADNTYYSLYDGEVIPYARRSYDLEIDHVVALNEAHQSGARVWSLDLKAAFSSDLDNLLHVSDGANQAK